MFRKRRNKAACFLVGSRLYYKCGFRTNDPGDFVLAQKKDDTFFNSLAHDTDRARLSATFGVMRGGEGEARTRASRQRCGRGPGGCTGCTCGCRCGPGQGRCASAARPHGPAVLRSTPTRCALVIWMLLLVMAPGGAPSAISDCGADNSTRVGPVCQCPAGNPGQPARAGTARAT